jgi:hypothetical protein
MRVWGCNAGLARDLKLSSPDEPALRMEVTNAIVRSMHVGYACNCKVSANAAEQMLAVT